MSTLENFQSNCRLCLSSNMENIPFIYMNAISIKNKLVNVFNFTLDELDQLPKNICRECYTIVEKFHEFTEKVQQNQSYLQLLLDECDELKHDPDQLTEDEQNNVVIDPDEIKVETWVAPELVKDTDDYSKDEAGSSDEVDRIDDRTRSSDDGIEEDKDWKPTDIDEETEGPKKKRKYTRKASLKANKLKNDARSESSNTYTNKSKTKIEEEDRQILDFFQFICELCNESTITFIDLKSHFRKQHGQKGYHRCCNTKLFKRFHLLEHMQLHQNPHLYECDLCSKSFRSRNYLRHHHMDCHAEEVERPFKCDQCSKTFITKVQLKGHLQRHQKYQCPKCNKFLTGKGSLNTHMINMHSDTLNKHICDTCGAEFRTKFSFNNHLRKHMGLPDVTSVVCEVCHLKLCDKGALKKHMIAKHNHSGEVFTCDICNKQAPTKYALKSHIRSVHCDEKHQCDFCEKRFKNPVTLKEHRASHTGEILYTCPFCPTTFNSKANMYAHRKKVHPNEWAQEKLSRSKIQQHLQD